MPEFSISQELLQTLQTVGLVIILYLAVLWLAMVVWAFNDARQRTHNWLGRIAAALMVLVLWLPGVILYMLLRPRSTTTESFDRALEEEALLQDLEERLVCPACQRRVRDDYVVCPHCESKLKDTCRSCGKPLHITWSVCPYCATRTRWREAPVGAEAVDAAEAAPSG